MTVGIAACGPGAGRAVLLGLRAVEWIGAGAIGGFVAFAAVDGARVRRLETQQGGTQALLGPRGVDALAPPIAAMRCAGLISSGPDRPEPLSQFLVAAAGVGLVTGHRLPNAPAADGRPFNAGVLAAMAAGEPPSDAVAAALAREPRLDAGVIALGLDGGHGWGDTELVATRGDRGAAVRFGPEPPGRPTGERAGRIDAGTADPVVGASTVALVLHNAIEPHESLAALVAEIVIAAMHPPRVVMHLQIRAGAPLRVAARNAVHLDARGAVRRLDVHDPSWLHGVQHVGLGDRVPVLGPDGWTRGRLRHEPLLVCRDGRVETIDGSSVCRLAVVRDSGE